MPSPAVPDRASRPLLSPAQWVTAIVVLGMVVGLVVASLWTQRIQQDRESTLARTEGVLLDPVYTAKAFGHLLSRIASGALGDGEDVVFVHTGGSPGLFAYASEWVDATSD